MNSRRLDAFVAMFSVLVLTSCAPAPTVDLQPRNDRYESCSRRAKLKATGYHLSLAATLLGVRDDTPVDGPVHLVLVRGDGSPVKATFASLFTRPRPTPERTATYRIIAAAQQGDCVHVEGILDSDGRIWVERFENLDRR